MAVRNTRSHDYDLKHTSQSCSYETFDTSQSLIFLPPSFSERGRDNEEKPNPLPLVLWMWVMWKWSTTSLNETDEIARIRKTQPLTPLRHHHRETRNQDPISFHQEGVERLLSSPKVLFYIHFEHNKEARNAKFKLADKVPKSSLAELKYLFFHKDLHPICIVF